MKIGYQSPIFNVPLSSIWEYRFRSRPLAFLSFSNLWVSSVSVTPFSSFTMQCDQGGHPCNTTLTMSLVLFFLLISLLLHLSTWLQRSSILITPYIGAYIFRPISRYRLLPPLQLRSSSISANVDLSGVIHSFFWFADLTLNAFWQSRIW